MNDSIFYTTVIIGLLLAVILVFFIISIVRYHKRYVRLQRERMHAEITIQENERRRIAGDLHDSLGPLLSSVKLQINSIEAGSEEDQVIIAKAGNYLDEIISGVREISHNLLPNTLERKGLTEAIREFISRIHARQSVHIDFYQPVKVDIQEQQQIHIFRMVQEIIQNTIKHSKAKNLQLAIGSENNEIVLLTKDDGDGFDVDKVRKNSMGLGLKSIESRVEILNGTLILQSAPGSGTTYFIKIPMTP